MVSELFLVFRAVFVDSFFYGLRFADNFLWYRRGTTQPQPHQIRHNINQPAAFFYTCSQKALTLTDLRNSYTYTLQFPCCAHSNRCKVWFSTIQIPQCLFLSPPFCFPFPFTQTNSSIPVFVPAVNAPSILSHSGGKKPKSVL